MASKKSRYQQLEKSITFMLIADLVFFIAFLFIAGAGIVWLKVILTIFTLFVSGLCLYMLWASRELFKPRSLWMTAGAISIAVCLIMSLLLNYPSPM